MSWAPLLLCAFTALAVAAGALCTNGPLRRTPPATAWIAVVAGALFFGLVVGADSVLNRVVVETYWDREGGAHAAHSLKVAIAAGVAALALALLVAFGRRALDRLGAHRAFAAGFAALSVAAPFLLLLAAWSDRDELGNRSYPDDHLDTTIAPPLSYAGLPTLTSCGEHASVGDSVAAIHCTRVGTTIETQGTMRTPLSFADVDSTLLRVCPTTPAPAHGQLDCSFVLVAGSEMFRDADAPSSESGANRTSLVLDEAPAAQWVRSFDMLTIETDSRRGLYLVRTVGSEGIPVDSSASWIFDARTRAPVTRNLVARDLLRTPKTPPFAFLLLLVPAAAVAWFVHLSHRRATERALLLGRARAGYVRGEELHVAGEETPRRVLGERSLPDGPVIWTGLEPKGGDYRHAWVAEARDLQAGDRDARMAHERQIADRAFIGLALLAAAAALPLSFAWGLHRLDPTPALTFAEPAPRVTNRASECPPSMQPFEGGTTTTPSGPITVAPFCLDRQQVTFDRFEGCAGSNNCTRWPNRPKSAPIPTPKDAVSFLSHAEAEAFCQASGARLQTTAEAHFSGDARWRKTYSASALDAAASAFSHAPGALPHGPAPEFARWCDGDCPWEMTTDASFQSTCADEHCAAPSLEDKNEQTGFRCAR